jgi:CrcB protein
MCGTEFAIIATYPQSFQRKKVTLRGEKLKRRIMIKAMLIAGLGGFMGTCLRYLTGRLCHLWELGGFPLGTFVVNIVGSFIIGALLGLAERNNFITPTMNVLLVTGFCGGFTTFSSFADDIFLLMQQRNWTIFAIYTSLSIILGVFFVWIGRSAVK